jgi:putative ABC transport system permease protein
MVRTVFQDLGYAVRSLLKNRGFTWVTMVTLALGIAASTAVFAVVNAVLLHPLPFPHADRVVILHWQDKFGSHGDISAPAFFLAKDRATGFESISAVYPLGTGVNLSGVHSPEFVKALRVSQGFFKTLGVRPLHGRDFRPEEDLPNGPHVVILSDGIWQRHFLGKPAAIGRQIRINDEDFTIIGVMPRRFVSYPEADMWVPLQLSPALADLGSDYRVLARLKDNVSLEESRAQLETISRESSLAPLAGSEHSIIIPQKFEDFLFGDIRRSLAMLSAAVLLVLMIACANVAMLFLVRASARSHEIAVRVALGSNRSRLTRIFLMEGVLIGVTGGLLGIMLAKESMPFILRLLPGNLPLNAPVTIDMRAVVFSALISLINAVIFGLAPAFRISQVHLVEMLHLASRNGSLNTRQARTGRVAITAQTALAFILLSGATLLLQDFLSLHGTSPGFTPDHLYVAQISLASTAYEKTLPTVRLLDKIRDELQRDSGANSIAVTNGLPLEQSLNLPMYPEGLPGQVDHAVEYRSVNADYLNLMKIPLLEGRNFSAQDGPSAPPVAIVNQTLARRWWPDQPAIGHFVSVAQEAGLRIADLRQIVGVAADVHEAGLDKPAPPTIFVPIAQNSDKITALSNHWYLVSIVLPSSNGDAPNEIRQALSSVAPDLPPASVRPLAEVIAISLARQRFYTLLVSIFGMIALLLTAVGLYALLSYQINLRRPEIVMRIVFGATRGRVVKLVIIQTAKLVLTGLAIGFVGALLVRQVIANLIPNTAFFSSSLFLSALLLGAIAAIVSILITAHTASFHPMETLRQQ